MIDHKCPVLSCLCLCPHGALCLSDPRLLLSSISSPSSEVKPGCHLLRGPSLQMQPDVNTSLLASELSLYMRLSSAGPYIPCFAQLRVLCTIFVNQVKEPLLAENRQSLQWKVPPKMRTLETRTKELRKGHPCEVSWFSRAQAHIQAKTSREQGTHSPAAPSRERKWNEAF